MLRQRWGSVLDSGPPELQGWMKMLHPARMATRSATCHPCPPSVVFFLFLIDGQESRTDSSCTMHRRHGSSVLCYFLGGVLRLLAAPPCPAQKILGRGGEGGSTYLLSLGGL